MKKSIWIKHFFCLLAFLIVGTFPAISIGNHYDFKLIGSQNGMPSIISCIYTEQKGFIWIGTPTGLIRFDGTELKKYTAQPDNENSLPNDSILQIIEDNQQTTWILTTTGIARYSLIHDNFFIPKLKQTGFCSEGSTRYINILMPPTRFLSYGNSRPTSRSLYDPYKCGNPIPYCV